MNRLFTITITVLCGCLAAIIFTYGCASSPSISRVHGPVLLQKRGPQKGEPLRIKRLTRDAASQVAAIHRGADVSIIVHPAYALFFDKPIESDCRSPKCALLDLQIESEARFIALNAEKGRPTILVLPADPIVEAEFPHIYSAYLNRLTSGSSSVYAVFSKTSSSGALDRDDMLALYGFLSGIEAPRVMIGGGYIGRCQKEFYTQLTTYFSRSKVYLVPEISVISPADISDRDAVDIANDISNRQYKAVRSFMMRKVGEPFNVYSISRSGLDVSIPPK